MEYFSILKVFDISLQGHIYFSTVTAATTTLGIANFFGFYSSRYSSRRLSNVQRPPINLCLAFLVIWRDVRWYLVFYEIERVQAHTCRKGSGQQNRERKIVVTPFDSKVKLGQIKLSEVGIFRVSVSHCGISMGFSPAALLAALD